MGLEAIYDIPGPDGTTFRQKNLAVPHAIPLGSLVEITDGVDDGAMTGVRMFVVEHGRDCDGSPLYTLSANRHDAEGGSDYTRRRWWGGFCDGSLRVISRAPAS